MSKRRREEDSSFRVGSLSENGDAEFFSAVANVSNMMKVSFDDGVAGVGAGSDGVSSGVGGAASSGPSSRVRMRVKDALERVTRRDTGGTADLLGDASGATIDVIARPALVCRGCGNTDESSFRRDPRAALVSCAQCGLVASDREIADMDWNRSFEGEEKTTQFGPAPDPLLSNRHNLGIGLGEAPGVSKAARDALNLTRMAIDMGTGSTPAGVTDKRTRVGYKDRMKLRAIAELNNVGDHLALPRSTVERAKVLFSNFRDAREHLVGEQETLAACLLAAIEESIFARRLAAASASESASAHPLPPPPPSPHPLTAAEISERAARDRSRAENETRAAVALGLVGTKRPGLLSSRPPRDDGDDDTDSRDASDDEDIRAAARASKISYAQGGRLSKLRSVFLSGENGGGSGSGAGADASQLGEDAQRAAAIERLLLESAQPVTHNAATKSELVDRGADAVAEAELAADE